MNGGRRHPEEPLHVGLSWSQTVHKRVGANERKVLTLQLRESLAVIAHAQAAQRSASPARTALARVGVDAVVGRLRFLNFEITADLLREKIVDFTMPRNGRRLSSCSIHEDRMLATFPKQNAAVLPKVTK